MISECLTGIMLLIIKHEIIEQHNIIEKYFNVDLIEM